jgi:glycosyltransferase involved in cell wall biosynthesis
MLAEAQAGARPAADHNLSVAFVASCPPRQCGIATFTSDLARAVRIADPTVRMSWAAINSAESILPYGSEVRWRIRQREPGTYRAAAEQINASTVDVVSLQHEFGLYGIWGETFDDHLAPFLEVLSKPLVTTLHSVLPDPSPSVRAAVQRIGCHSRVVVAMANLAHDLLIDRYSLDPEKVQVIPHGVPAVEPTGRRRMKRMLGLDGRTIVSTFGLVDPRKGLEYMIEAMVAVAARQPEALYLIVGKTHPNLVRQQGETYRQGLVDLVRARDLTDHVAFVDEYLTQRQIVDYLLASDVYVTPYLDPNQITSGTLAYALGAGKAIISTRYLHATETLANGRGILVDFRDSAQLAAATLRLLTDPIEKADFERRAYAFGRQTAWPNVGRQMLSLFEAAAGRPSLPLLGALPPTQVPALPDGRDKLRPPVSVGTGHSAMHPALVRGGQ